MSGTISRKFSALLAIALVLGAARAEAAVFATYDATQHNLNGFQFADFNDFFAVDTTAGVINIDIQNDLDGVDGLFGGMGSDLVADFDANTTQLEVALTVGPNNAANAFRVTLQDNDGPGTGDEHVYEFDISTVTPGVPTTLTIPMSNGPLFTQGAFGQTAGDGLQNYGLRQLQIQSVFDSPDRLNILVDSVKLVDPDDPLLIEFTSANYNAQPQNFAFGTFQDAGVLDTSGPTMIINADPTTPNGPDGGFGFTGLNVDFEATDYQIEIEAKLLANNAATAFNLLLGDNDGDDSAPMMGSDDYIFTVDTSNFNETDFSTVTIPLGTGTENDIVTTFGFTNGGDGLQNFGLSQMQIQATDALGLLGVEISRFAIVERPATAPGDFDEDGDVDGQDFLVWQRGVDAGTFDAADLADWQNAYGGAAPAAAAAAVPEPTSSLLMLSAVALASLRRSGR